MVAIVVLGILMIGERCERRLRDLAMNDQLTGILNRRGFFEASAARLAKLSGKSCEIAIAHFDIDFFEAINDKHGHPAGDTVIAEFSRRAARAIRRGDILGRIGGEEFALLLPNTDANGCAEVGERVGQAVRDIGLLHALNPPSKVVTASVGGASNVPAEVHTDQAALVAAADRALYAAKHSGRDRVVMSGQVVAWPGARSA